MPKARCSSTASASRPPTPCLPHASSRSFADWSQPVPAYDRISVGFPGMVRNGRILTAPHLVLSNGPGSKVDQASLTAWHQFNLAAALAKALGKPTRVVNDADLQGLDVAAGKGLEVVVTLGTGFGTAVLHDGQLTPHMEFSQHRFRNGDTYDEQLGDEALQRVGKKSWSKRVHKAIAALDAVFMFDHLYIGGGNARHLQGTLGARVSVIDTNAGLLGGIRLWDQGKPSSHTNPIAGSPRRKAAPRRRSTAG